MKPSTLLRVASAVSLLYFAGHMSGMPWTPSEGTDTAAVLEAMKSFRFDVTGSSRTYWDFYVGFGLIIGAHLLVQTVALWHLGTMARRDAAQVRPLVGMFGLALVANAILAGRFFFAVPVVLATAIAICLGLAFMSARTTSAA